MKSAKASRRKIKQSLRRYELYTVDELEEREEPLEIDESYLEEDDKISFQRRRKLNWDDD